MTVANVAITTDRVGDEVVGIGREPMAHVGVSGNGRRRSLVSVPAGSRPRAESAVHMVLTSGTHEQQCSTRQQCDQRASETDAKNGFSLSVAGAGSAA